MMLSWSATIAGNSPAIVGVAVLAGSLGIPVPSLAAVVLAGALLAQSGSGLAEAFACFAAGLAGAVIGDLVWFSAGRRYGGSVLGTLCRLSLSRDSCVTNTAALFARRGVAILLFARFAPGLSLVSAPLAGATGVSLRRFLAYAEAGASLWLLCGLAIGSVFAGQIMDVLAVLERFGIDVVGTAVTATALYAVVRWVRRRLLLRRLRMARVSVQDVAALLASGATPVIVDVRPLFQQQADPVRIPGARSIHDENAAIADGSHPVIVYCSCPDEVSAAVKTLQMRRFGFANVSPLKGGLAAWREAGHPVEAIDQKATEPAEATTMQAGVAAMQTERFPARIGARA
jgi:membrane protein DedA with SNARE-associated domain/rhodanese-related sulfurtransferase